MTGFYDLTPGRLCGHCGRELSRYRKTFCSNACRESVPRAFVGNPKGRPARQGTVTPEFRTALAGLWADGITTAQIGLRLGVTKNSIIGFAHRWGLVPRGSPIIRTGPAKPRAVQATLRKLPSLRAKSPGRPRKNPPPPHPPASEPSAGATPPVARPHKDHTPPVAFPNVRTCQWINDGGGKCGDPTVEHGSWCEAHRRRVFAGRGSLSAEAA